MFFAHCHRTRFRDSFCLASVFEMTVYLLTYLLQILPPPLSPLHKARYGPRPGDISCKVVFVVVLIACLSFVPVG